MKPGLCCYLALAISIVFFTGCNNVSSNTTVATASPVSKIGAAQYSNIALYHYAVSVAGNESSMQWLQENNQALYHLVNFFRYANGASLKWLKGKNYDLYCYGDFLINNAATSSGKWLKENNPALYRLAYLFRYQDKSSLQWLQKNNKGFYHLGNFMAYGDGSSLQWLKEH
jgi:hypothetical protein